MSMLPKIMDMQTDRVKGGICINTKRLDNLEHTMTRAQN